jgi:phenylacetate-CoA ligase
VESGGERATIPYYWKSLDWARVAADFPPPPNFTRVSGRRSADELRAFQNRLFLERVAQGWKTQFYKRLWGNAGLEPGDIRSLEDIGKLPSFTSDDLKQASAEAPPYGSHMPFGAEGLGTMPLKVQTSGGTTGLPRITLFDPMAWEIQAIQTARAFYAQGARPGDRVQILFTNSLANAGWCIHHGVHAWLGAVSITTGSGVVTPSLRQLEFARALGTNIWFGTAEYLGRIAEVAEQNDFNLKALPTKFLTGILGVDVDGTVRQRLEEAWGAPFYDTWGSHEVGPAAFECSHKDGKHVSEDTCYIEIADVEDDSKILPYGTEGNVIATSLARSVPLFIRYNMRDRLKLTERSLCACGLETQKLSLFLGRSDEMVKLRGTNVYPMACLSVVSREPRVTGDYICVAYYEGEGLGRRDEMAIRVERKSPDINADALASEMAKEFKRELGVKVGVQVVEAGELSALTGVGGEGKPKRLLDLRKTGGRP